MKRTLLRILCLNLALIVLLSFSVTAFAAAIEQTDDEEEWEPVEVPEWAFAVDEYTAMRAQAEAAHPRPEPLLTSPELLGDGETYTIKVGAYSFESDTVISGPGWSYTGSGVLNLTDYNGGPIAASSDLTIYTNGTVTVQGKTSDDGRVGYEGIDVYGSLIIEVESGTLTVNGGDGIYRAGNAILAKKSVFFYLYDGEATLTGGNVSDEGPAGDGIQAPDVGATGTTTKGPRLTAYGGRATGIAAVGVPGCGINGGTIWLGVDAEIGGGRGPKGAPAVLFSKNFTTGLANISLFGGKNADDSFAWPVQFDADPREDVFPIMDEVFSGPLANAWYQNPHTTLEQDEQGAFFITVNRYVVTLYGKGGRRDGATYTDLVDYFPAQYDLAEYVFAREGYAQTGWINASGDLERLDIWVYPDANMEFAAAWTKTDPGDVVLNGMGGMIEKDDESFVYRYTGAKSVSLPDALFFSQGEEDEADPILGWHTQMEVEPDENGILSGAWYSGGSNVQPNAEAATVLYANDALYSSNIVYHAEEGAPKAGGDILVHRSSVTDPDLKLYAADGREYLTAPEGCRFAGWAETPGGEVKYAAGDEVAVEFRNPTHLYAVWATIGGRYSLPEKCEALVDPESETITLTPAKGWIEQLRDPKKLFCALYDDEGRMIGFGIFPEDMLDGSGGITLNFDGKRLPVVKVFGMTASDAPAGENIRMDLPELEPEEDGEIRHID